MTHQEILQAFLKMKETDYSNGDMADLLFPQLFALVGFITPLHPKHGVELCETALELLLSLKEYTKNYFAEQLEEHKKEQRHFQTLLSNTEEITKDMLPASIPDEIKSMFIAKWPEIRTLISSVKECKSPQELQEILSLFQMGHEEKGN